MIRGWFITGTDTGVGKTYVSVALLRALVSKHYRAVGMKPVASGCRVTARGLRNDDAEQLQAASFTDVDYGLVNPYAFAPPIAPHIAAMQVGIEMQWEIVEHAYRKLADLGDYLVVEGAGGWRVPFNRAWNLSDMANAFGLPIVLVVGIRLGCINHALLSAEVIEADGCRFAGWIANRCDDTFSAVVETEAAISERLGAPLATFDLGQTNSADALLSKLLG